MEELEEVTARVVRRELANLPVILNCTKYLMKTASTHTATLNRIETELICWTTANSTITPSFSAQDVQDILNQQQPALELTVESVTPVSASDASANAAVSAESAENSDNAPIDPFAPAPEDGEDVEGMIIPSEEILMEEGDQEEGNPMIKTEPKKKKTRRS